MRFHSPRLPLVLARGGFDSRWVCDVFYDGIRQMQDVLIEDVKLTEDGTAKVQQSGSMTIIYQGRRGESIAPQGVEDILSPFGTTLVLYILITDGPKFEERVPMGTFVVSDTPTIESVSWSFRGQALSKGDRISVTFKDPFYKVLRNRFDVPGVTPSLTSCYAEIQRLTRMSVTRALDVPDAPIPRAMVYEEDRLDAIYELASKSVDGIPYMTSDGSLSIRPNAWTDPVDEITAANVPGRSRTGTLVRVKRGMSADGVYNRVVVRAQGQQAGVLAAGEITDGPLRAANTGGLDSPFGRVPYFLSSQLVTTPEQAQAEVQKWLPRVSRPQAVVLDIEEIMNPLREVGDVVTVRRVGEEFPARVVKVQRTKAKTQTTSVLVVPSA